jgi:hypothetical protein
MGKRDPTHTVILVPVDPAEMGRLVVPLRSGAPVFQGLGHIDYACASCGAIVCRGVHPGMFSALGFRCRCGALMRVPDEEGPQAHL